MLVYRDAVRRAAGPIIRARLSRQLEEIGERRELLLPLVLEAGEVEAALEDSRSSGATAARELTDALAEAWIGVVPLDRTRLMQRVDAVGWSSELTLRRPEGYAYYALDPASFALAMADRDVRGRRVVVAGVRSIGTSAGAIVRAALIAAGACTVRFSVRPDGHPWDRRCTLDAELAGLVARWSDADYVVVDEGPGLSGSTFLAVAERLEESGIPRQRIELITSREADPHALCAPRAAERWGRFTARAVPARSPLAVALDACAGSWRRWVYASEAAWPAAWTQLERRKYLRVDGVELVKFAGFSPYGDAAARRAEALADAGFCPPCRPHAPGYAAHRWCRGAPLGRGAARAEILPRLLDYLAFRHRAFSADGVDTAALDSMLQVNVLEAIGTAPPKELRLDVERPVYVDGRLLPHEWIQSPGTPAMKVDATDHGDDHLLPGPCDSAWDLAGAIVEWNLTETEAAELADAYESRTGDPVGRRQRPYVIAYAAFRAGCCDVAQMASAPAERVRLSRARARYCHLLRRWLGAASRLAESVAPWR